MNTDVQLSVIRTGRTGQIISFILSNIIVEHGDRMDEQLEKAKQLFFSYQGHFFQMNRGGDLEEYKTYNIATEVEAEWYKVMIDQIAGELSIMNWNAVFRMEAIAKYYKVSMILEKVISFVSQHIMGSDSIVKLMYAEKIIEIIRSLKNVLSDDVLYKALKVTLGILEDIISKPLVIDPGHELKLFDLKDKKSLNNRARKNIDVLHELLG